MKLVSGAINDNLDVRTWSSTSFHGKQEALRKPSEPVDTCACDVPNVDDFNDFWCDEIDPNEIDIVDQTINYKYKRS